MNNLRAFVGLEVAVAAVHADRGLAEVVLTGHLAVAEFAVVDLQHTRAGAG